MLQGTISPVGEEFSVEYTDYLGKKVTQPAKDKAVAEEILGNAANSAASHLIYRAAAGGKENKVESLGLLLMKFVANEMLADQKIKAKDLTPEKINEVVSEITPELIDQIVEKAKRVSSAYQTLRGKFQAPMKGGRKPSDVAAAAGLLIVASPGAAQRESAKTFIGSSF